MKCIKKIKCLTILALFLSSFILSAASSFTGNESSRVKDNLRFHLANKSNSAKDSIPQLVSEENENESEDDFKVSAYLIPFLISCFNNSNTHPSSSALFPAIKLFTDPIYIAVCNFRI